MKRRLMWISAGSLAASVVAVGVLIFAAWLRAPTIPAAFSGEWTYYTSHFANPRVRACLPAPARLQLKEIRDWARNPPKPPAAGYYETSGTGVGHGSFRNISLAR